MSKIEAKFKKCKNCGGNLVFSPSLQALYCDSCQSQERIDTEPLTKKHDYNVLDTKKYVTDGKGHIKCQNCGSSVETSGNDLAVKCPYCDTPLVVQTDNSSFSPDFIIPFKFDKQEAGEMFRNGVKKKFFLPNKFKKKPPIDKIESFYFPAFSFDEDTFTKYSGKLANDRTERTADGKVVTKTTYKTISGTKQLNHENVFVETSSYLTQEDLEYILPYGTRQLYKYDGRFVMGYSMEKLSSSLDECKKTADLMIDASIRNSILSGYSYDRVVFLNTSTQRSNIKYAYGALPVYRLTYTYKNKEYKTLLNGQTGKVGGGLPKSKIKIALTVLLVLLIVIGVPLLCFLLGGNK